MLCIHVGVEAELEFLLKSQSWQIMPGITQHSTGDSIKFASHTHIHVCNIVYAAYRFSQLSQKAKLLMAITCSVTVNLRK